MKYRAKFLASIVLPTMLAVSSIQGCGESIIYSTQDLIKITSLKDSYKKFGISKETLREIKEVEAIMKQEHERIGNDFILELMPSTDFEGNVEKGNEGKIAKIGYAELTEKIANALNRKYREDEGIQLNGEAEENAPKVFEPSDISIEPIDIENKIYGIYVKGKLLFSNVPNSKNRIDKEVLNLIQSYFDFLSIDVYYKDIKREQMFKILDEYLKDIEDGLEYELEYTKDGSLKKGKSVDRYFFGQDESRNYEIGD